MKSNILYFTKIIILSLITINSSIAVEIFNFDVTEIEIKENGNKFIGKKGGIAKTNDGTSIKAENFNYDKINNILIATGNVEIIDQDDEITIFSDKITYLKNKEIIYTEKNSKAININFEIDADQFRYNKTTNVLNANGTVKILNIKDDYIFYSDDVTYLQNDQRIISKNKSQGEINGIKITSNDFDFDINKNIFNAIGNVRIEDSVEDYIIFANEITYFKNQDRITTKGKTKSIIQSKYDFVSDNVTLDRKIKKLKSKKESIIIDDNFNKYKLSNFIYSYDTKFLKGKDVEVESNYSSENSDKYYFKSAFINFENDSFISKDTNILFHSGLFDKERNPENEFDSNFLGTNDPRISSVSSIGDKDKTILNKAVFTSCKKNDTCPPWSIKANKIVHDKIKKEISYKDAVLNLYDVPVFYFPKFFHPDPTVERRSGLLQPRLNNSNILGSSINIPYFHVLSENKDLTLKPTIFDSEIYMFQNEYRQENENSSFIADFSYTKGYKSNLSENRNSISHLFSKFDLDLNLKEFSSSKLSLFLEKVNNDTYLKIFENVLQVDEKFKSDLEDKNNLTSGVELTLDHQNYNFSAGLTSYENLQEENNDRYQYILPYYNYTTSLFSNNNGSLSFDTNGRNTLSNTNNLRSKITNTLKYSTSDLYSKLGFVNNFGFYLKNLNATGKNDAKYKSSIQSELLNIYEFNSSMPLINIDEKNNNYITPKVSFRINPSDMKNFSTDSRLITTDNIFDINRLGLTDSYEAGKSLTLGLDYKKENKVNNEKYFEIKLASILRDKEENKIPTSSTANRTASNLFGSIENKFSNSFKLNYDFALDNDFNKFEHNSIEAEFAVNNFVTTFNFLEKNGEIGDTNTLENTTKLTIDTNSSLLFKTRRNRKISLTEYYDLIYEYQNDCLTAGIKYRKTYYQDRDLKPKEDLFFTITLFPLTTLDQKIDQSLYRNE